LEESFTSDVIVATGMAVLMGGFLLGWRFFSSRKSGRWCRGHKARTKLREIPREL